MLTSMLDHEPGAKGLWIDLCDPEAAEIEEVEQRYGIRIPALSALREIEYSSRLRVEDAIMTMTAPIVTNALEESEGQGAGGASDGRDTRWETVPTGFILTPDVLVTVRYGRIDAFAGAVRRFKGVHKIDARMALVLVLEEIVDRAADEIEAVAASTSALSRTIFFTNLDARGLNPETSILRRTIVRLGRASDHASRVRYMFLSIGRMAHFVSEQCKDENETEAQHRLGLIDRDIASLDEFESSLAGRIQFLLDSATSLIGIEQNNVVKVLTVVSVIGVPPVLVVGIYGMNFKHMPELSWPLGYPFALGLCVLSGILPWLWFKWRRWI